MTDQYNQGIMRKLNMLITKNNQLKEENIHIKKTNVELLKENDRLQSMIQSKSKQNLETNQMDYPKQMNKSENNSKIILEHFSKEEKIKLFRSLFRGREDVYALHWETKNGKSGYSPACANEWLKPICKKPVIKCSECKHRTFLPITDQVIKNHLIGKHTIGLYPLLQDETSWFLAIDFDKTTWKDDCLAFIDTCKKLNVPAVLERSRSGNGGHVWIFFEQPISASLARKFGTGLLTNTMENRYQLGLDSYDRLFPNQDTIPKGGFGNLIALPLQYKPRNENNSVFIEHNYVPYKDQWLFLSQINKLKEEEVKNIVYELSKSKGILGMENSSGKEDKESWDLFSLSNYDENINAKPNFPTRINVVRENSLYVEKTELPSKLLNQVIRLAAFQNPEFYKAQALRLPTYNKPRIINCADETFEYIGLPRGCYDGLLKIMESNNIQVNISDKQFKGISIDVDFLGELTALQQNAVATLLEYDQGILSATTAFGKTVVAIWMIAARKVNTLILVHRTQLMEQWKEKLNLFLDIPSSNIGLIGSGKNKRTGIVDIATIQSLNNKGRIKEFVTEYGQIIVDEAHHISAFSFEQVLKKVKAKFVLGLTATPIRKDGHHPIIMMQCGPIRYKVDAKSIAKTTPFEHLVVPRKTNFVVKYKDDLTINEIYESLITDEKRNYKIFDDLLKSLEEGRSPILLTERLSHVEYFSKKLKGFTKNIIVLRGGMGKKEQKEIFEKLANIPDNEERVIIATGKFIGEGFDDSRLDTLFLVMPISWKGTLQQYAGRLHRLHSNKKTVKIYDYIDEEVPLLMKMFEKRKKSYNAMGYIIQELKTQIIMRGE